MATVIDALVITLGLDAKGVKDGMNKAETTISAGVKNIVGNILAPLAGAFAFSDIVKGYLSAADAVGKLSDSLNLNAEDMQAWGEAAKRSGGSADAFYSSLSSVSDKVTELTRFDAGGGGGIFAELGISPRDAGGNIKNSIQIMEDLAGASSRFGKTEFATIAKKLGIDDGSVRLLRQGKEAVSELVERQRALGVYTSEDAEIAAQANIAIADLIQSFKAMSADILRIALPALTWLADKFTSLVIFMREHKAFMLSLLGAIAGALTGILLPAIISVGAAMLANPLTWIFIGIAAAVLAVAAVIEDLYVYINGGQSALAGFWSMFGSGEEIAAKLSKAWETVKTVLAYAFTQLWIALSAIRPFLSYLMNFIQLLGAIFAFDLSGISEALKGMSAAGDALLGKIGQLVLNFLDLIGVKEPLLAAWQTARDFFMAMMDDIMDKIAYLLDIPGKIRGTVGGLIDSVGGFLGFGEADTAEGGTSVTAAEALSPSVVNNTGGTSIQSESNINVGQVTVQTQATDAKGIAAAIPGAINDSFSQSLVLAANTGVIQK